jgi:CheY-like chemotaxis protein
MVILVADDDHSVRALLRRCMARRGWSVLLASTGKELVQIWGRERPRLILSDVDMQRKGDGLRACSEIRGLDPEVRIHLMSGAPENGEGVLAAGFGPILGKPFTLTELDRYLGEP